MASWGYCRSKAWSLKHGKGIGSTYVSITWALVTICELAGMRTVNQEVCEIADTTSCFKDELMEIHFVIENYLYK